MPHPHSVQFNTVIIEQRTPQHVRVRVFPLPLNVSTGCFQEHILTLFSKQN